MFVSCQCSQGPAEVSSHATSTTPRRMLAKSSRTVVARGTETVSSLPKSVQTNVYKVGNYKECVPGRELQKNVCNIGNYK